MRSSVHYTRSEEETIALGRALARQWTRPRVILLIGDLGAGKTTLAKGIAAGVGAASEEDVSSPTFPLIHEYGDPAEVYHVDLYRLDTADEAEKLGLDEIFDRPTLVLMEWAERFPSILPAARVEIRIEAVGEEERRIEVSEIDV
jgi:tRNA threonylcarbamoyladenosine biosynthesis protein TsaE